MEIKGKIIQCLPEQGGQSKSGSTWRKRDYILETVAEYPKKVCFSLWGDNIDKFKIAEGETINASIDIESREFNGRWYTDVKAWKIDRSASSTASAPPDDEPPPEQEDDLPF